MGMKTFIRVGGFLVLGGLGLAGLTGCSAAHAEVCVSDTYRACRCGGGLVGRMACVDGAFIPCQCPESCVGANVGLLVDCSCAADTGLGTESQRYCQEDGYYTQCFCEREPRNCEPAQRAPCLCASGGHGWATCAADGVYEACACIEPDGGWPDACRPLTCEAFDPMCGEHADGCGGTLDCGACAARG